MNIQKSAMKNALYDALEILIIGIAVFVLGWIFLAEPLEVTGDSMEPNLSDHHQIIVEKLSMNFGELIRGDIIVFESEAANNRLIKRVIGLPGDNISMHDEVLTINGKQINYQAISAKNLHNQAIENLIDLKHIVKYDQTKSTHLASFKNVTVPADHYLVLGDNRRNSADSRVYGFVPRGELKGKAEIVAFSLNYDNYYLPKPDRFLQDLYTL